MWGRNSGKSAKENRFPEHYLDGSGDWWNWSAVLGSQRFVGFNWLSETEKPYETAAQVERKLKGEAKR